MKEMFSRIKDIFAKPSTFFKNLREEGIKNAFLYAIVFSLFSTLMNFWIGNPNFFDILVFYGVPVYPSSFPSLILPLWVIAFLSIFITTGIIHLFIMMFGGKKGYSKTYQIMIYSSVPTWLLGWVPYVGGLIGFVYGIYLIIKGTSQVHNLSIGKAIGVYASLIAAFMLFAMIIGVIFAILAL